MARRFVFKEVGRGGDKLSEPEVYKLEKRHSWQNTKHTKL